MKLLQLFLLAFLLSLLINCQSSSNQIKNAFDRVNKSLEESNEALDNSLENIYNQVILKRYKNKFLAEKADTVYVRTIKTCSFLDSLNQVLLEKDTTGTNLDLSTKLLINTKLETALTEHLLSVYDIINSYPADSSTNATLKKTLQVFREIKSDKSWPKKYFQTTPTMAAVTILTKFKNDCSNAAAIVLKDINRELE